MKYAGLLMLPAGLFLVLSAIVLFSAGPARSAFVVSGLGVEALGLFLAIRGHIPTRERRP